MSIARQRLVALPSFAVVSSLAVASIAHGRGFEWDIGWVRDSSMAASWYPITTSTWGPNPSWSAIADYPGAGVDGDSTIGILNSPGATWSGVWTYARMPVWDWSATDGTLETIELSIDARNLEGVTAVGFFVVQGGRRWTYGYGVTTTAWMTFTTGAIGPDAFIAEDGLPGAPDFTGLSGAIHWGFRVGNSSTFSGYQHTVLLDNFTVRVTWGPSHPCAAFPGDDDCDGNGVKDACDIKGGAADANGNAVPDLCECAGGDLNLDGDVDGADLAIVLNAWGAGDAPCADIDRSGVVDGADLAAVLSAWR